jgi:hypothetical protein
VPLNQTKTSNSANHIFHKTALATAISAALAIPQLSNASICAIPDPDTELLVTSLTTSDDHCDGVISIREAIQFANANDQASNIITFAEDIMGTIEVSEALVINKSLTITGPGKDVLTLKSNSNDLFSIDDPEAGTESGLDFDLSAVTLFRQDAEGEGNGIISHQGEHGGKITLDDIRIHEDTQSGRLVEADAQDGQSSISLTNSQIIGVACNGDGCPEDNSLQVGILIDAYNADGETNTIIENTQASHANINYVAAIGGNKASINVSNVDIENIQSEGKSVFSSYSTQDTVSINFDDVNINKSSFYTLIRSSSEDNNTKFSIVNSKISENEIRSSLHSLYGRSEDATYAFTMENTDIINNEFSSYGLRFSQNIAASILNSNINNNTISVDSCCPSDDRAILYFDGDAAAESTISNSSISNNAQRAIYLKGDGSEPSLSLKIINSTLSGNQNTITLGGAVSVEDANLTVEHSTIANNAAKIGAGGILNQNGNVTISNSIIAGNSIIADESGEPTDYVLNSDLIGAFSINSSLIQNLDNAETKSGWSTEIGDFGIHLVGDGVDQTADTGNNLLGRDPLLQNLEVKGGLTPIHDLTEDSPARNAGIIDAESIPEFDQRGEGFPRLTANTLDLGAVQFHSNPVAVNNSITLKVDSAPVNIKVLSNDATSSNGLAFDLTSVVIMEHPAHGKIEAMTDGTLTFSLTDNFIGDVSVKYTVADIAGNRSNEATVTISIIKSTSSKKSSGGAMFWFASILGLISIRRFKK